MRTTLTPKQPPLSHRILSVILTIALVVSLCPTYSARAVEIGSANGLREDSDVAQTAEEQSGVDELPKDEGGDQHQGGQDDPVGSDDAAGSTKANGTEVDASAKKDDSAGISSEDGQDVTNDMPAESSEPEVTIDESAVAERLSEQVEEGVAEVESPLQEAADVEDAVEEVEEVEKSKEAEDQPALSEEAIQVQGEDQTLIYESDGLKVTVSAAIGVLPDGATLEVEEIHPVTEEKADAYGEALASLSEALRKEDKVYSAAKVYDIRILDEKGTEIEPNDKVSVSIDYQKAQPMGEAKDSVDVAHLTDAGELQMMDAEVDTTKSGAVKSAEFTTDSFSYYIVFSSDGMTPGGEHEVGLGSDNWLRFYTPAQSSYHVGNQDVYYDTWGHGTNLDNIISDAGRSEESIQNEGSHRYLRVFQAELINAQTGSSLGKSEYFWTWENNVRVVDFNLDGYVFVEAKMETAWADSATTYNGVIGSYQVRGYESSTGTEGQVNTLKIYVNPAPSNAASDMRYIIRYVHADGSVSDGGVRYLESGQSVSFNAQNYLKDGEEAYSGTSIVTGADAIADLNDEAGTGRITYNANVDIAKVYIYYKRASVDDGSQDNSRYDKEDGKYRTDSKTLYTEKNAEKVSDRQFLVNLETWYVDSPTSVGMVLDASGSMAWTAGVPAEITHTNAEWNSIFGDSNWRNKNSATNPLSAAEVAKVLHNDMTDNTTMGYNGFHYYIYDVRSSIKEYVALGYSGDTTSRPNSKGGLIQLPLGPVYSKRYNGAGWYFVNSQHNDLSVTGKSYEGLDGNKGPCKFYIVNGKLMCQFWDGENDSSNNPIVKTSVVYEKRDSMFTKNETLQDAVAQFGSILLGNSPESEVSMTRFSTGSTEQLPDNKHVLLNWSSSTVQIASSLDQLQGSDFTSTKASIPAGGNGRPAFSEHLYGLTAQTNTYRGISAFQTYLENRANDNNHKYLIIFTDGKDTRGDAEKQGWGDAGAAIQQLKNDGYTIMTVLMKSLAMEDNGDYASASAFLQGLASGGKNGNSDEPLYFEADSDSAFDMVEEFRKIASHITTAFRGYSVRDYIDPRFDVVNEAGVVLSVLNSQGEFTDGVDANGLRVFTTPDGKQAKLGYDKSKKQFYVLWQNQDIPLTDYMSVSNVNPWQSRIRIQAKEDFLGGNDILTNGDGLNQNLVYRPQIDRFDNNGNPIPKYDANGLELIDNSTDGSGNKKYPNKTFPYASVNPGLLDVKLSNYEDTVFLGEEVTPGELLSNMMETNMGKASDRSDANHRVADTVYNAEAMAALGDEDLSSKWYVEYLERLGKKLHNNPKYYYTLLRHVNLTGNTGVTALITALKNDSQKYTVQESAGQVTVTSSQTGEKITIIKTGDDAASVKLELPYYYLTSPTDPTIYAGPTTNDVDPQEDQVGTLTYEWKLIDFAENVPGKDGKDEDNSFVGFGTYVDQSNHMNTAKTLRYQFSMDYVPLAPTTDATSGDNGSERTRALTGLDNDALIRNTVGRPWAATADQSATGLAAIHAVDGRILVEKRMLATDLQKMKTKYPNAQLTLKLTGAQSGEVWTKTLSISGATALRTEGTDVFIVSEWATGLPQDDYTLTEELTDEFGVADLKASENVIFHPEGDSAEPYDGMAAKWKALHDGVTWHIGKQNPGQLSYVETTFAYSDESGAQNTVNDSVKNVDPQLAAQGGKNYLNAQLGRALVTNVPATTSIDVSKTWSGAVPTEHIVVKLVGSDGSERYKKLEPNAWTATFDGLDVDGTRYTAVEGAGTVDNEGKCADFSAFDLAAAHYEFDGKTYRQTSLTYSDIAPAGGVAANDAVVANVKNKAGSIAFANECVTKVTVVKHWEGITPAQPTQQGEKPLVIKLHPSTGSDRFVELNPTNEWTHTFEDVPVMAGLVYTIVEGRGTVGQDGSCTDFEALTTTGTYTFDGKTYRQKAHSLLYTPAGTNAQSNTAGLDGSVSPDAGTAEVTNEALTSVKVEKVWEEDADPGNKSIYVQLYKHAGGNESAVGDAVELKKNAWSHTWEDLKVEQGSTYAVKEGKLDGGAFEPYEGVFTLNGQRMKQISVELFSDEGKTTAAQALDGSVSPFGGVAVITNGLVKAHVELEKVDATESERKLSGAVFELYRDADTPAEGDPTYDAQTDTQKVKDANDATSFTTNASGHLTLPDLLPGAYWLKEAVAPTGYMLRDEGHPTGIVVDDEGVVTLVDDEALAQEMRPRLSGPTTGVYTITMPNLRTYLLPATGGPGVYPFLFVGAFIAVYALGGDEIDVRRLCGRRARKGSRGAFGPLGGD